MFPTAKPLLMRLRAGFTLVEMLVAMMLLGLITLMLFTSFYSVTTSWETGRKTIDASGHSDYLMDQLTVALRSAYYPGTGEKYGLIFTDDGEDAYARDSIEWTKVGAALIGEDAEFANVPHRVRVTVVDADDPQPGGFAVRAWRQDLQLDEFDPEEDAASLTLSPKVVGFNCRMLDPETERDMNEELNWIDEWTKTNTLPRALEVTLWMEPAEEGDEPIESKRIVELPMGILSQDPSTGASSTSQSKPGAITPGNANGPANGNNFRPGGMRPGGGPPGGDAGQVFRPVAPGGGATPPMPGR